MSESEPRIRVRVSWLAVAAMFAAWIGALSVGVDATTPTASDLVSVGGNYGPRTWGGQWWRLLAAATVHAGWLHLAVNAIALALLGTVLERRIGAASTAAVLLGATSTASAAALAWAPYAVSVGASGAVAGVCGALAVALVIARHTFEPRWRAVTAAAVALTLGWGVVLAATTDRIDHAAHAAGVLTGLAIGALVVPRPGAVRALAGLGLAGAATAVVLAAARPPIDVRARAAEIYEIEARYDRIIDGVGLRADGPRLARTLEEEVIGPLRVALARLVVDDRLPDRERRFARALAGYTVARLRALALFARHLDTGDDALLDDISAAQGEARAASDLLDE